MSQPAYTVLARRYRPQTFDDVVGQGHVGQALRNAIRAGRVAHAYLFTGARGVGKTSTARIFAKALNCPQAVDGIPCNECEVCVGIAGGGDVDVLEIDGASNRGIDDIRQLRANVNVKSMRSRFKVYIIDEVHMLTKEAFNALLKTLEEPPANVKFVFCTTEPNKLPDTILSRCQRFDFGTIATGSIASRLSQIAETEGVHVDADAVELVARRAAGSMRDSQSLFDQLLAFGEEHITTADVHKLLGTAPDERLLDLFEALIQRDRASALSQLADALDRGVQIGPFSDQLLEYVRDLMIVLAGAQQVTLLSVGESLRPQVMEQGERWGLSTVTAAMQILAETKSRMLRANYARALLELALVRISLLEDLENIGRLVRQVASGSPIASGSGHGRGDARPSQPSGEKRSQALREKLQGGATTTAPVKPPSDSTPSPQAEVPAPQDDASDEIAMTTPAPTATEQALGNAPPAPSASASTVIAQEPAESAAAGTSVAMEEPPVGIDLTPATVEPFWAQLLQRVPDTLAGHLKNAENIATSGPNAVEIRFPRSYVFSMNYCQREQPRQLLGQLASDLAGKPVKIGFRVDEAAPQSVPRREGMPNRAEVGHLRPKAVEDDPFVQEAVSIFGGTVVDVRKVLDRPAAEVAAEIEADDPTGELDGED